MTTPTAKRGDSKRGTTTGPVAASPHAKKFQPNRNTIAMRPYNHKEMTKSEMYADLKKAVENTK